MAAKLGWTAEKVKRPLLGGGDIAEPAALASLWHPTDIGCHRVIAADSRVETKRPILRGDGEPAAASRCGTPLAVREVERQWALVT